MASYFEFKTESLSLTLNTKLILTYTLIMNRRLSFVFIQLVPCGADFSKAKKSDSSDITAKYNAE